MPAPVSETLPPFSNIDKVPEVSLINNPPVAMKISPAPVILICPSLDKVVPPPSVTLLANVFIVPLFVKTAEEPNRVPAFQLIVVPLPKVDGCENVRLVFMSKVELP